MSKRSKLSKNICRGENNYTLRFTQVNSLVVQQNGTCPCLVHLKVFQTSMQIATLSKRNCNCITAERNVFVCSKSLVATANSRLVRLKVLQTSMLLDCILPKKSKVARNVNFHYTLTITRVAPPSDSTSTKLKCPTVRMYFLIALYKAIC